MAWGSSDTRVPSRSALRKPSPELDTRTCTGFGRIVRQSQELDTDHEASRMCTRVLRRLRLRADRRDVLKDEAHGQDLAPVSRRSAHTSCELTKQVLELSNDKADEELIILRCQRIWARCWASGRPDASSKRLWNLGKSPALFIRNKNCNQIIGSRRITGGNDLSTAFI